MSISAERMGQYAQYILNDEECFNEVLRGMSAHFFEDFCSDDSARQDNARAYQGCLKEFARQLRINLENMSNPIVDQ